MCKCFMIFSVLLLSAGMLQAQDFVFDPYDVHPDSNDAYIVTYVDGPESSQNSHVTLSLEESIVSGGASTLRADWRTEASESWGGFAKVEFWHPDSQGVWDFSLYEDISFMYYIADTSTTPGRVQFRLQFSDVSDAPLNTYDVGEAELWYSFQYFLSAEPGWNEMRMPMADVGPDAFAGENGFYRTGWSGIEGNNTLDLDQIKGIGFEFSTAAPADFQIDSGVVIFDELSFKGAATLNLIFFNGRTVGGDYSTFAWNGGISIADGEGATPGTNAIRWDQGGEAWTGAGFNFAAPVNMTYRWMQDSVQFKMKAEEGTGLLRLQFEDADGGTGHAGINFTPTGDNEWHDYKFALRDFVPFDGAGFDTSTVNVFQWMAEGTGSGKILYIDDLWTGDPIIDIIPPVPPTNLSILTDTYVNLLNWLDSANESGETYNVYWSLTPIDSLTGPEIEVVERGQGISENTGAASHFLFNPISDVSMDVYYAVTAVDIWGNESDPVFSSGAITNTARGIPTMSLNPPSNFAADGNLSEWAGVTPFRLFPSEGAHVATNFTVDDDDDLSALFYMAADAESLYIAYDVNDDVVDTSATNSYEKDSPDLFLGLYNWHGTPHSGYSRGDDPDYHFRFNGGSVIIDNIGSARIASSADANYHWGTKFPAGYVVEGAFAWSDIADPGSDDVFVPVEGYRIPFNFNFNDADNNPAGSREGIMAWSVYDDDTAWQSPSWWFYTWIGETTIPNSLGDDPLGAPRAYTLRQNYPNPFNPVTKIEYTVAKAGKVSLDVYNLLGQKVRTLIQGQQAPGSYSFDFDASNLASGIYFYRLQTGDFVKIRKMMLVK